jgi:hypothetical protein
MWNVKPKVTPVITRVTRTIPKSFSKYLSKHTGKAQNQGTTENSLIRHCRQTSESTNVKVQNVYNGK